MLEGMEIKYKNWLVSITPKLGTGDGRPQHDILLKNPEGVEFVHLSDGSFEDSKSMTERIIDDFDQVYRRLA